MGPVQGPIAAFQAGARNLAGGLGSIVNKATGGMVGTSPEELGAYREFTQPLQDEYGGAWASGEIIPALAAAPAGLPGMVGAGALHSAALAPPEDQAAGAAKGAAVSLLTGGLGKAAGRIMKGTVKESPAARKLAESIDEFIPLRYAAQKEAGGLTTQAHSIYDTVLGEFFPLARAATTRQTGKALDKITERLSRTAEAGRSGARELAESMATVKAPVTPATLVKAGRRAKAGSGFQRAAQEAEAVLQPGVTGSNIAGRNIFYRLAQALGGGIEIGGLGLITRGATLEGFQKFLLGSTKWQRVIQKGLDAGDKVGLQQATAAAIRAYAVEESK